MEKLNATITRLATQRDRLKTHYDARASSPGLYRPQDLAYLKGRIEGIATVVGILKTASKPLHKPAQGRG